MDSTTSRVITLNSQEGWQVVYGHSLHVEQGNAIFRLGNPPDSNTLECADHDIGLIYDLETATYYCPCSCGLIVNWLSANAIY